VRNNTVIIIIYVFFGTYIFINLLILKWKMKEDPLVLELFLKDQQTKTDVFVPDCLDAATQTEAAVAGTIGYHAG